MTSRLVEVAERAVIAVAWAALIAGASVMALTVPVYTSAAVQALSVPDTAGLSTDDTVRLTAKIRAFVADPESDPLPATWRGAPAFDVAAVSHLADVRSVLSGTRVATAAAAALLAAWVGSGIARRRWSVLVSGMRGGAIAVFAAVGLAALVALVDFERFFSGFHGLFFQPDTWRFPYDSMLIRLFPERFWVTSGIAWGTLSAALAGGLGVVAAYVSKASPFPVRGGGASGHLAEGGSRMAEDV